MILADYLLLPALLYGLMATWAHALVPAVPTFAFVVVFVGFNTLVTARGVTMSDRTNFVILMIELATLALFAVFTIKLVFVDGGGAGGFSLTLFYQPGRLDPGFKRLPRP